MPLPVRRSKPGHGQLLVGDAGGDEHAVRAQAAAARELDDPPGALGAQADGVLDRQQLGAEPARLVGRAAREVGAAEPGREAEVVLDPARHARPGRRAPRARPARSSGPRTRRRPPRPARPGRRRRSRGRSARPRARRTRRAARRARARSGARAPCRPPAAPPAGRSVSTPVDGQQLARLGVALDVEPAHRHAVAGEEVAQVVRVAARSGARSRARRRTPAPRPPPTSSAGPRRPGTAAPRAGPRA